MSCEHLRHIHPARRIALKCFCVPRRRVCLLWIEFNSLFEFLSFYRFTYWYVIVNGWSHNHQLKSLTQVGLISHHIETSDLVCSLSQLTGFDKIPAFAFNPFLAYVPLLYPLKTQKNRRFFGVFSGYKMGTLARNGLRVNWGPNNNLSGKIPLTLLGLNW